MAVRDEDFGSGLTLVESDDGIWSSPEAAPACAPRDWRSECEREHARAERERARADAAEARCEELRWAEVESRARTGSLKWQLDRSRSKLKAAVEETQEVRRTAKDALWTHPGKVEAPYTVCIASASNLTGLVKSSVECRRTGL